MSGAGSCRTLLEGAEYEVVRDGVGVNDFDCFSVCVRVYGAVCFGEATDVGSDGRLE